jgi:dinuclear metal center YbgI/SA1388 family protein
MATVHEVLDVLEGIAPRSFAFDFDKVGLQVGDLHANVRRAVVSLDRSRAAVKFAKTEGAQLLLAHHPLIFTPIEFVGRHGHVGTTLFELIEAGIAFIAAHTNWDCAVGGINDALAAKLSLVDVEPFGSASIVEQLKMVVTAPTADSQKIVDAASAAGAGQIGRYSRCAFLGSGTGTFIAGAGANPTIGEIGKVEEVEECRIEMTVVADRRWFVEDAVRRAHPYEEPSIDLYPLTPGSGHPAGRVGKLPEPKSLEQFTAYVEACLRTKALSWGQADRQISRVAVVGGAADSEWIGASNLADVFVTGEVKQHVALEAVECGSAIIAAGHYATEQPGCVALRDRMALAMPDIDWLLFEPQPGEAGRPL